jgi:hypothetical protein
MAWDLNKLTRNNNTHLKKAWGIYTPQKRKLAVGPQAEPVRPVPHTGQTGVRKTSRYLTGQARDTPKTFFKRLALHHQDEMTQVRLEGFVSTL